MGNKVQSVKYVSGAETGSGESDAAAIIPGGSNSTVELAIECRDLRDTHVSSTMDPFVVVFLLRGSSWIEVARTEIIGNIIIISNAGPSFFLIFQSHFSLILLLFSHYRKNTENTSYPIFDSVIGRFNIDDNQHIKFIVYDACNDMRPKDLSLRKIVASAETTVGAIVRGDAHWESALTEKSGTQRGMIYVSSDIASDAPSVYVCMRMRCEKVESLYTFAQTNSFIRISKLHPSMHWMSICKTGNDKGAAPKWSDLRLALNRLANSDLNRNIKFELWGFETGGKHKYICETILPLSRLAQMMAEGRGALGIPMGNAQIISKKVATTLHFDYFQTFRVPTLAEYMNGGVDMCYSLAIDFSGSNGTSSSMFAHHTSDPHKKMAQAADLYLDAISEVGGVMTAYDNDGLFPAFGFQSQFVFALSGDEGNTRCLGVEGMSNAFKSALTSRPLVGPTLFEPVIRKAIALANATGGYATTDTHKYVVLIVLTDGKFTDKQKTIDAVAEASQLPLSIMFVGVGDDPVCVVPHHYHTLSCHKPINLYILLFRTF